MHAFNKTSPTPFVIRMADNNEQRHRFHALNVQDWHVAVCRRLTRNLYETDKRGRVLVGAPGPLGRREPDHGFGLRLQEWNCVPLSESRLGALSDWEKEALKKHQEYLNRVSGASVPGRGRITPGNGASSGEGGSGDGGREPGDGNGRPGRRQQW